MKTEYFKAMRLANELTAELQRLEHRENDKPENAGGEASDQLSAIRYARDKAIDVKEAILDFAT